MKILCLNGGSSSLKFTAYQSDSASPEPIAIASGETAASSNADKTLGAVLARVAAQDGGPLDAIGHRIVFGGARYAAPVRADEAILRDCLARAAGTSKRAA